MHRLGAHRGAARSLRAGARDPGEDVGLAAGARRSAGAGRRRMGQARLVEIVVLSGFYQMFAAINQGFGISRPRRTETEKPTANLHPFCPHAAAMPATPADLFASLDRLGIAHRTVTHPPLFTVEQSRALRGKIPGGHTKNLFLRDKKGALFLVTALEDAAIELKSLHRRLGATGRFSFGSADLLRETLGVEPGAVTPFAAINDTARPGDGRARCRPDGARDASTAIRWPTP